MPVESKQTYLEIPVREQTGKFTYLKMSHPTGEIRDTRYEIQDKKDDKKIELGKKEEVGPIHDSKFLTRGSSAPKAAFYVDAQDELEVDRFRSHSKKPAGKRAVETLMGEARQLRRKVIPELAVNLRHQFDSVVVSFWREVRGALELREVLTRDVGLGGLSLSEATVATVIKEAAAMRDTIAKRLSHGELKLGSEKPGLTEDILEFDQTPPSSPLIRGGEKEGVASSKQPAASNEKSGVSVTRDSSKGMLATEIKTRGEPLKKTESIKRVAPTEPARVVTVGPIDELGSMNLAEFRRLAKTPIEAAQKIFQKVDLLGDESIELKAQGIEAWHCSPLYGAYIEVGQKSLAHNKSVEEVVSGRRAKAPESLTVAEFHAIADLNRSLNF